MSKRLVDGVLVVKFDTILKALDFHRLIVWAYPEYIPVMSTTRVTVEDAPQELIDKAIELGGEIE